RRLRFLADPAQHFRRPRHASKGHFREWLRAERLAEFGCPECVRSFITDQLHGGGVPGAKNSHAEKETQQPKSNCARRQPPAPHAQCFGQTPGIEGQILQWIWPSRSWGRDGGAQPRGRPTSRGAGAMRTASSSAAFNREPILFQVCLAVHVFLSALVAYQ